MLFKINRLFENIKIFLEPNWSKIFLFGIALIVSFSLYKYIFIPQFNRSWDCSGECDFKRAPFIVSSIQLIFLPSLAHDVLSPVWAYALSLVYFYILSCLVYILIKRVYLYIKKCTN